MPDKTRCQHCQKIGLVRTEHVIQGHRAERYFYCGGCGRSWALPENSATSDDKSTGPPDRSRA